jgi:hypothetical protein
MEELLARQQHREVPTKKLGGTWEGATPFLWNCRTGPRRAGRSRPRTV